MSEAIFKPTPEQLAAFEAMRRERDDHIDKAKAMTTKLEAWDTLCGPQARKIGNSHQGADSGASLTVALESLVNASTKPLTYEQARVELRHKGFSSEKLKTAFYISLKRLKDKERIAVSDDKLLSRMPRQ
jgi:hypothetical protein